MNTMPAASLAQPPITNVPDDQAVRPRVPYPVRLVLMVLAMLIASIGSLYIFIPLAFIPGIPELSEPVQRVITLLMRSAPSGGAILVVWLLMRFIDRRPLRETGLRFTRFSVPLFLLGIAGSALAVLPAGLILQNAGILRPDPTAVDWGTPFWTAAMALTMGLFMQGFPEELIYRGYGLQTMRERPVLAWLVSGLIFGAMHIVSLGGQENLTEKLIYLLGPTTFGLLAGALAIAGRSVWAAVGVHFGSHLATFIGNQLGMGTGPALWVAESTVYLVLIAIVFVTFRQRFREPISLER